MNIVHIGLAGLFTENMTYQDNLLSKQNALDGHNVMYIANNYAFVNGKRKDVGYINKTINDGIQLIRLPLVRIGTEFLTEKLRKVNGLSSILNNFAPDVIFSHGITYWSILDVTRYKREHPNIKLYADTHADFNNTGRNFLSKNILHKMIYKCLINNALPVIDKIFYITYEAKVFVQNIYNIPEAALEFYPLGGVVFPKEIRMQKRDYIRKIHGIEKNKILLIHSGKMGKAKKTYELVQALHAIDASNLKLLIIGTMTEDVAANVMPIVDIDPRIEYLGWQNGEELMNYLCAADLYVQPGTQSATMQNALCCGSAAALYPYESHKYLLGDSVFYIETIEDMKKLFTTISINPSILEIKRVMSNKIARERLDYKVLAARLYR